MLFAMVILKLRPMKRIIYTLFVLLLLFLVWLFRPGPGPPEISVPDSLPVLAFSIDEADEAIRAAEERAGPLKPDNHARIVWNETYRDRKAPCSVVYIHGFSSSYGEGAPLHTRTAEALGCHLYVTRLHGHGLVTDEPLKDMHPDSLLADAGEALAIGNLLGDEVVLIGNSMGGTLALHLASVFSESVDALVLLSPLIEFATGASVLFDKPWGQRIMRLHLGGSYLNFEPDNEGHDQYWYNTFRIEAMMNLKTMKRKLLDDELPGRIRQPVFVGYYYRDEEHQDDVVSAAAIRSLEPKLGTPPDQKQFMAFPGADAHVISSAYRTDVYAHVTDSVIQFLGRHIQNRDFDESPTL